MTILGKRKGIPMKPHRPRKNVRTVKGVRAIVKSVINSGSEHKMYSPALVSTTVGTTASVADCCPVAQDDGEGGRIGNKISPKFVKFLGAFSGNSASRNSICRLTFIQWFPATTPVASDVFKTARSDLSPWNDDNGTNFRVLFDKRWVSSDTGNNRAIVFKGKVHPVRGHGVITFTSDAVTVGAGKIYWLASCSDNTNQAGIEIQTSLYYTDS